MVLYNIASECDSRNNLPEIPLTFHQPCTPMNRQNPMENGHLSGSQIR